MAAEIDLSPKIQRFKQMAGVTILHKFNFFKPDGTAFDITAYNIRVLGIISSTGQTLTDSVFSNEVLNSANSNRNGLFLREGTVNELVFLYDVITDTSLFNQAAEGVFLFKLILTDTQGIDSCPYVFEHNSKKTNISEIDSTSYIANTVNITYSQTTVQLNVTIQTLL